MPSRASPPHVGRVNVYPIDAAPVREGEPWGPCLLAPGLDLPWTIGEWDGEAWCEAMGFRIKPRFYGELPLLRGIGLD